MAAALIHPIGGGQFSASASKSGLCLSPGLLAVGGVRAAFQEWRPGERAAPHSTFVPPEHSGATRGLGTHLRAVGRPTIWQRAGVWDLGSNELEKARLGIPGFKASLLTELGLMQKNI